MTTVLLVRHGRTTANGAGVLAGWTEGVGLDDAGREQVKALAGRLRPLPLAALVASPLQRCQETVEGLLAAREDSPDLHRDERVGEVRYGDWSGQELKALAEDPLWQVVQHHPSAVVFPGPGGESMAAMQQRAVAAVREWNSRLGPDALYVVVSHADVIKAVLADALGMHLDQFQRIVVDPASVSVVRYTSLRPFVLRVNDVGGDLSAVVPSASGEAESGADAVVGGGAGGPLP